MLEPRNESRQQSGTLTPSVPPSLSLLPHHPLLLLLFIKRCAAKGESKEAEEMSLSRARSSRALPRKKIFPQFIDNSVKSESADCDSRGVDNCFSIFRKHPWRNLNNIAVTLRYATMVGDHNVGEKAGDTVVSSALLRVLSSAPEESSFGRSPRLFFFLLPPLAVVPSSARLPPRSPASTTNRDSQLRRCDCPRFLISRNRREVERTGSRVFPFGLVSDRNRGRENAVA